jgi:hypothetical protein
MNFIITGRFDKAITNPSIVGEIPNSSKYRGNITTDIDHFRPSEKYKLPNITYLANLCFEISIINNVIPYQNIKFINIIFKR